LYSEHIIWLLTVMRAGLDRAEEVGGFEKKQRSGQILFRGFH
jgi:hypothetical protein